MRLVRALSIGSVISMAGLALPVLQTAAVATVPVVTVSSDSADINMFEFVNSTSQTSPDTNASDFFSFAHHLGGSAATVSGPSGTSTAFVRQSSTVSTPAQSFPASPVGDIALDGLATSAATVTNDTSTGVPVTDSHGTFSADFTLDQDTPVFFSGFLQTTETDLGDGECSYALVDVTNSSTFTRHFEADSPAGCRTTGPTAQRGWAQSTTMPAGDYTLSAEYYSELDDTTNEAHSMTASASASFNLAFMPPSAAFTTKLSGSKATFDASGSSAGVAARPLASYRWTFGDGKKATTTTPTVTHSYPTSPTTAPTYKVMLQVADSGNAISAPVSHLVHGTATTLAVSKTATKLKASGKVSPRRGGHHVVVTLARKSSGSFHVLATHKPTLTSTSTYATTFARPHPGTCRLTTRYPGDATHLASTRVKTFSC